ncbi:PilZ domain-containing protein [Erythrobacter litoralis]|uniref:PilZ domain-containing protein n=1 Tax=Erythrobacter litoralis TaxID=39960 RepID=UPI0002F19820|nr:PilZ domain-containing protein [Erythrobacter litoralis]
MVEQSKRGKIGCPAANLFLSGRHIACRIADVTTDGVLLIVPAGTSTSAGDTVAVSIDDFPSAVARVQWVSADRLGLEFRTGIDASVVAHIERERAILLDDAAANGTLADIAQGNG